MISLYSSDMKYAFVSKKNRTTNNELLKRPRSWTNWYTETEWGLFALFLTGLILILAAFQYGFIPWFFWQFRSFCKIKWEFENQSCPLVQDAIVNQIQAWGFNAQCWGYNVEGCKYKLLFVSPEIVHAQHTSNYSVGIDVQDLVFSFTQEDNKCKVQASAISLPNLGTLFTDAGCNYCTLRNLPRAVGLHMFEYASEHECKWRQRVNCLFETGSVAYHRPPHFQGIYENGRLISAMLVEGDDLEVSVIPPMNAMEVAEKQEEETISLL